jgi:hypothetical protein
MLKDKIETDVKNSLVLGSISLKNRTLKHF